MDTGIKKHILSTKTGVFVDRRSKNTLLSTKKAILMDRITQKKNHKKKESHSRKGIKKVGRVTTNCWTPPYLIEFIVKCLLH